MSKFVAATAVLLGGLLTGADQARADHCYRGGGYYGDYGAYSQPYGAYQPYGYSGGYYNSGPYGGSYYGTGYYGARLNVGTFYGGGFYGGGRHHHHHHHGGHRGHW